MPKDRIELAEYFNQLNFKKGAEVGVADGRYSEILCKKIPGLRLFCIDPFYRKGHYERALERLANYDVSILRKTSMETLYGVSGNGEQIENLDFVFIDGNHSFNHVMEDIIGWTRKVRAGGIVSGHDYYHFINSGVVEAVNKYCEVHRMNLNLTMWNYDGHKDDRCPSWWFVKK